MSEKPAVLISRCLLGEPCRWHGRTHVRGQRIGRPALVRRLQEKCRLVPVCPEVDGGLPTPRPRTKIINGRWISAGEDVTRAFHEGAQLALALAIESGCERAYLLGGSPACDREHGAAGRLLAAAGIKITRV